MYGWQLQEAQNTFWRMFSVHWKRGRRSRRKGRRVEVEELADS